MNMKDAPVYGKLSEFLSRCQHHDVNFDIAKCLMDKIDDFPDIMIDEIAFIANTTAPTVTKFVKRLGYTSFKSFRQDLEPYHLDKTQLETSVLEFIENDHQTTIDFFQNIDLEKLRRQMKEIMQHSPIIILNSSYSLPFSDQLKTIFETHQKQTYILDRHADMQMLYQLVGNDGVAIIISLSGRWLKQSSFISHLNQKHIAYYLICPKEVMEDESRVVPWIGMELFHSYYHSNRYLALLGKAIEYVLEENFPKMEND